jgi:hypothetical protein
VEGKEPLTVWCLKLSELEGKDEGMNMKHHETLQTWEVVHIFHIFSHPNIIPLVCHRAPRWLRLDRWSQEMQEVRNDTWGWRISGCSNDASEHLARG